MNESRLARLMALIGAALVVALVGIVASREPPIGDRPYFWLFLATLGGFLWLCWLAARAPGDE